jgi:type IV pilus assembly protein PilN
MSNINLLPWRQDIARYKNRIFGAIAGTIVVTSIGANFILSQIVDLRTSAIQAKIEKLNIVMEKTQETIKEVNSLQEAKKNLIERNKIIQSLQNKKTFLTTILNTFATTIPDGVQISEISMTKDNISLKGSSSSDSRIFKLLQNLENVPWIKSATFDDISKKEQTTDSQHTKQEQFADNITFVIHATIKQDIE